MKRKFLFVLFTLFTFVPLSAQEKENENVSRELKNSEVLLVGDMKVPLVVKIGNDLQNGVTLPAVVRGKKNKDMIIYAAGYRMLLLENPVGTRNLISDISLAGKLLGRTIRKKNKKEKTEEVGDIVENHNEFRIELKPADISERYFTDIAQYYYEKEEYKDAMAYTDSLLRIYPKDNIALTLRKNAEIAIEERKEKRRKIWKTIGKVTETTINIGLQVANLVSGNESTVPVENVSFMGTDDTEEVTATNNVNDNTIAEKNAKKIEELHKRQAETQKKVNFQSRYKVLSKVYDGYDNQLVRMQVYPEKFYDDKQRREIQRQMKQAREEIEANGYKIAKSPREDWQGN